MGIWTGTDFHCVIFKQNVLGNVEGLTNNFDYNPSYDTPAIDWCLWQDVSIESNNNINVRKETGKPVSTLTSENYDHKFNVGSFILHSREINPNDIFNRENRFRIFLINYPIINGIEERKVQMVLISACIDSIKFSTNENGYAASNVSILAEDYIINNS